MSTADALILFGASGDLAHKMLLPALYHLEASGVLPRHVVGVSMADWTTDDFRAHARGAVTAAVADVQPEILLRMSDRLAFVSGTYADRTTFDDLADALPGISLPVSYLAIPPVLFSTVVQGLNSAGLAHGRVVVEKPFGRDLASAKALNRTLHKSFTERSIYRIDHFLGKEALQNILTFRYANSVLDPIWNRRYIDHIQITMAEDFGVAGRGSLYDELGTVRDVIQNHLLQLVALLTMEAPSDASADAHQDEVAALLHQVKPLESSRIVRGRYDGFLAEDGVATGSVTETYAAVALEIASQRWSGVPIYIRAGKMLPVRATVAEVVFAAQPDIPFLGGPDVAPGNNRLTFHIGPDNGIELHLQGKAPGDTSDLAPIDLSVGTGWEHTSGPGAVPNDCSPTPSTASAGCSRARTAWRRRGRSSARCSSIRNRPTRTRRVHGGRPPIACWRREWLGSTPTAREEPSALSDLQLGSDLDHLIRRDLEVLHGARRVAVHDGEQVLSPDRHPGAGGRDHGLTSEDEGGVGPIETEIGMNDVGQRLGYVRPLEKPVTQDDLEEPLSQRVHRSPSRLRHHAASTRFAPSLGRSCRGAPR